MNTDAQHFMNRMLFASVRDTAVKRYQPLSPFEGMLEGAEEIVQLYQDHAAGIRHLVQLREDRLSALLADASLRFTHCVGPLTWGELAKFGAVRENPTLAGDEF